MARGSGHNVTPRQAARIQQELRGELPLSMKGPATPREELIEKIRSRKRNKHEDAFDFQARAYKLPPFERDYRFAKSLVNENGRPRQWRFDFAFVAFKVALEVEGLVVRRIGGELVTTGRHATADGFREDCIKYASAALLGWTVLRFEQTQIKDGTAIEYAQKVLAAKGWER
jgi:very-short-patch-repair endonuclease